MLASQPLIAALNQQVGNEMGAAMQYVSIAAHFDGQTLKELARFFYRQAEEEREHALRFVRFIVDAGGVLEIPAIPAPRASFASAAEAVELALGHEEKVSRQIDALVELARSQTNYAALRFLDWFVKEQFEEVTTMAGLLQVVRRAGEAHLLLVEEFLAREGKLGEPANAGPAPQS